MTSPTPPQTAPSYWVPVVHYLLALAAGGLTAAHSTFHLTPAIQAWCLVAAVLLVVVGTLVYFLERKASLTSMLAYLRSVVPDVLTVLDEAKGESPTVAARITSIEADIAKFRPVPEAILNLIPGHAAAQGATTVTPLPVVSDPPAGPVVVIPSEPAPAPPPPPVAPVATTQPDPVPAIPPVAENPPAPPGAEPAAPSLP